MIQFDEGANFNVPLGNACNGEQIMALKSNPTKAGSGPLPPPPPPVQLLKTAIFMTFSGV